MPGGPEDCVADREHIAESTGSTSQQWSTNSGTQPLTISCGFPTPYNGKLTGAPAVFAVSVRRRRLKITGVLTSGQTGWLEILTSNSQRSSIPRNLTSRYCYRCRQLMMGRGGII